MFGQQFCQMTCYFRITEPYKGTDNLNFNKLRRVIKSHQQKFLSSLSTNFIQAEKCFTLNTKILMG